MLDIEAKLDVERWRKELLVPASPKTKGLQTFNSLKQTVASRTQIGLGTTKQQFKYPKVVHLPAAKPVKLAFLTSNIQNNLHANCCNLITLTLL
jgi:hypothetical protein